MRQIVFLCLILKWVSVFSDEEIGFKFNRDNLPDFRLAPAPILIDSEQAVASFMQLGPRMFRGSGTYAIDLENQHLCKGSFEFLSQKLGFSFDSGRTHRWTTQGALGVSYRYPLNICFLDHVDFSFTGSKSFSRKLPSKVAQLEGGLLKRRIAGAEALGLSCKSSFYLWESGQIEAGIFYDYARYLRHYKHEKTITGLGLGLALDQRLFRYFSVHVGVDVRPLFIFYNGSIASSLFLFGKTGSISFFGEKVQGLKQSPSSSRFGVEIGFAFGKMTRCSEEVQCERNTPLCTWTSTPAVYMPEVLVLKDQKQKPLSDAPSVLSEIGVVPANVGAFSFQVSSYFSGSSPLVFGASGLPSGLSINPVTGTISGTLSLLPGDLVSFQVFATNYAGRATQVMTIQIL